MNLFDKYEYDTKIKLKKIILDEENKIQARQRESER